MWKKDLKVLYPIVDILFKVTRRLFFPVKRSRGTSICKISAIHMRPQKASIRYAPTLHTQPISLSGRAAHAFGDAFPTLHAKLPMESTIPPADGDDDDEEEARLDSISLLSFLFFLLFLLALLRRCLLESSPLPRLGSSLDPPKMLNKSRR